MNSDLQEKNMDITTGIVTIEGCDSTIRFGAAQNSQKERLIRWMTAGKVLSVI